MTSNPATCPYCNSLVSVTPGTIGGQRLACPRCGESFTLLTTEPASTDISGQPSAAPPLEIEPGTQASRSQFNKPFRTNRRIALILLGVMACMAVGALAYALHTQSFRRDNDKGIVKKNPKRRPPLDETFSPDDLPTPPAKLAALAWLPPNTTMVLGVHVRELMANPAGKSLLTQPLDIGGNPIRLDTLADWTEFKTDDIDHLVLGLDAEKEIPTPILIVRTRHEINAEEFYERLNAQRAATVHNRTVYEFKPRKPLPLFTTLYVCVVDSRTAVYALLPNHFNDLPATPQADLRQLPLEVRDVLRDRVGPVGPLWIVGHSDDWNKTRVPFLFRNRLMTMKEKDRQRLLKVSTFAAWVEVDDPMLVRAAFDCGDDVVAKDLQKYFDIPDVGVDPDWKASADAGWLSVQIRTSLKKVREALER